MWVASLCFGQQEVGARLSKGEFDAALSFWTKDLSGCKIAFRSGGQSHVFSGSDSNIVEPFPLGSLTKSFTAILVLKLVDLGKLGLDDRLGKFGFDLPGEQGITVRMLLSQTSGLPDYFYSVDPATPSSPSRILSMIRAAVQRSRLKVGEFHYANTNYWLLGAICERSGGLPFGDLVKRYIDVPLGIDCRPKRLASFDLNWYGGAGSLASSLPDLTEFANAVSSQSPKLLGRQSWKEFSAPHVSMAVGGRDSYGDGVIVSDLSVYPVLTHGGTIPANGGVPPFASMYIARRDPREPMSLTAFTTTLWGPSSENALYGAFAAECATADAKQWIARFCDCPSRDRIAGWVGGGQLGSALAGLLTPKTLRMVKGRLGSVKAFVVRGEQVTGESVKLVGDAVGSAGSARVNVRFGQGGILESFGIR
jgi:hypothetical protein